MLTATGLLLSVVVPLPNIPLLLPPQQYAVLVLVSAQVCNFAATIEENMIPEGIDTACGVDRSVIVPSPRAPSAPLPQQYAAPVLVTAHVWYKPAESEEKVTPAGIVTAVGILLAEVVPLPNSP